jgi:thiol-disulfide isomerase/thioredoxin
MNRLLKLALLLFVMSPPAVLLGEEVAGIGVALGKDGSNLVATQIYPDTPAAFSKAIAVGDRIIAVGNGNEPPVEVSALKINEVASLIRGVKGTTVRLTIIPVGKAESDARVISLVRGELKMRFLYLAGEPLAVGTKAPNIQLLDLDGKRREQLADFAGKFVVLEFWATWCGPCQKVVAELQTYSDKYPAWKGKVVLITVNVDDDADDAIKHLKAKGWDKTHNVWVGDKELQAYHVDGFPTTYIIDPAGMIAAVDPEKSISEIVDNLIQPATSR